MAQILIRNLDTAVVDRLKKRAECHGRSLQTEVKGILEEAAAADPAGARALAARIRRRFSGRRFGDSTKLVRDDRRR